MIQMKNLLTPLFALLLLAGCSSAPAENSNGKEDAENEKTDTKGSNTAFSDGQYQINQDVGSFQLVSGCLNGDRPS
jgi:PBP1b-binding outer membrane lipoprotein LpoB